MTKETYPAHGRKTRPNQLPLSEYEGGWEGYEERIFNNASHFNIVRYKALGGSEVATTPSFRKALQIALADDEHRYLIYVVGKDGAAFCMSHKDYNKFAGIYIRRNFSPE